MSGYYGTERQKALQIQVEDSIEWVKKTPGACNPGRFLGTDDPDQLGWENIFSILSRDNVFSFQLVSSARSENIRKRLQRRKYRIDFWDVFVAPGSRALSAAYSILKERLPKQFRVMEAHEIGEAENLARIQSLLIECGIAPFSASILLGEYGSVSNAVLVDDGNVVAYAFAYFPHNKFSGHVKNAWCGLVAVSPDYRGMGLGKYVNALLISNCVIHLKAESIHQFVAPDNLTSRKMVESSGLQLESGLICGLATNAGDRFTR